MEEVEAAAKAANATDFLNTMPQATVEELHVAVCCSERRDFGLLNLSGLQHAGRPSRRTSEWRTAPGPQLP